MVKTFQLPNGITCVCDERPGSGKVALHVQLRGCAADDAPWESGLTDLTQEALQTGTVTRSREQIAKEFESRGGVLKSRTGPEKTSFSTEVLARETEGAARVLADVLRHPAFDPAALAKVQSRLALRLAGRPPTPAAEAEQKFNEQAFGNTAFGSPPPGAADLMKSFTPAQVRDRHAALLSDTAGLVISFAGDITAAEARALAERNFGDLPAAAIAKQAPKAAFSGGDTRRAEDNGQLSLFFGFRGPARQDPDRLAAMMLQGVLSGGLSAPLPQEIRVKRGLAYAVYASYFPQPGDGSFALYAGAAEGKAAEVLKAEIAVLGKIAREGVSDEALEGARARFLGNVKASNEEAQFAASGNADLLQRYNRLVPLEETAALLRGVTSDDLRRVCIDMLKDGKYALSAVGPLETLPPPDEIRRLMQEAVQGLAAPAPGPAVSLLGAAFGAEAAPGVAGAPEMTVLPNGLTVVSLERPGSLTCGAWLGVGADHETREQNGFSHVNEHMASVETEAYPPGAIPKIVEGELHGLMNAGTGRDSTCYYFFNLGPEALEKTVDICGQMVFKAAITEKGLEAERGVVLQELARDTNNANWRSMSDMMEAAYPDQPHGRTILGPESGLRALKAEQLRSYRDAFHKPNNVIFCAVGPVRHADFVAAVREKFGDIAPGPVAPLPKPEYKGGTVAVPMQGAQRCNVRLGAEAVAVTDPETYAYQALAVILGVGYDSRLYKKVVAEGGLASGTGASTDDSRNGGAFFMTAQTEAASVKPLLQAMYGECRAVTGLDKAEGLTEAELDRAKTVMEMTNLRGYETSLDACGFLARNVQAFGRIVSPAGVTDAIRALTVDDVKRAALKVLAQNPTAVVIAPPGTDPALLPSHEDVVAMRDGKYAPFAPVPSLVPAASAPPR